MRIEEMTDLQLANAIVRGQQQYYMLQTELQSTMNELDKRLKAEQDKKKEEKCEE